MSPPWLLLGLLVVASMSMWLRKRSWTTVIKGPSLYAAIGAAAGLVGLVLALLAGTPVVERITDQAVQWSTFPIVRGSGTTFGVLAILVALGAVITELVLRGWIVEYMLERRMQPAFAILAGAIAEALVTEGDIHMRIGAGVFGLAMGWMFVAGGRSVVPTICARAAFTLGALALEAARVVG